jgi:hypothetical protein
MIYSDATESNLDVFQLLINSSRDLNDYDIYFGTALMWGRFE